MGDHFFLNADFYTAFHGTYKCNLSYGKSEYTFKYTHLF